MLAAPLARRFDAMRAAATLRQGVTPDNGCALLDICGPRSTDPLALGTEIKQRAGVVTVDIVARQRASVGLPGTADGVRTIIF